MPKDRIVSKFKQSRSMNTKRKIIKAAGQYFCCNGYYGSSVKGLADAAGVSVGSFYFYFKDKDELLIEVYRQQSEKFIETICKSLCKTEQYRKDRKAWLHEFILDLLHTYGDSWKLRLELKVLNYENPQVAVQRELIKNRMIELMVKSIENSPMKADLKVKHLRTAILFIIDIVDAAYDRMYDEKQADQKDEIIEECFNIIYKYLML